MAEATDARGQEGDAGRWTGGSTGGPPTCLGEADDLGDLLVSRGPPIRLPVQVGDLDAPVFAQLAGVQLAQRRDQSRLGHGVGDVGPVAHLEAVQNVPLDGLQEIAVHFARLFGWSAEAARGASVQGCCPGRRRRSSGAQQQPARFRQQKQKRGGQGPLPIRPVHADHRAVPLGD